MSDSFEPSYYEIALTSRQLLGVALLGLLGLGAAFYAGVWVSQEGMAPEWATADRGASTGEPTDDVYAFFEEEHPPLVQRVEAAPQEPASTSSLSSPPQSDRGRPVGEAAAETGGPSDGRSGSEPASGSGAVAQPAAVSSAPEEPAATPEEVEAARSAVGGSGFVIQVFSGSDRDRAEELLERLVDGGEAAFLAPLDIDGRTLYRVRVGPFEERSDAQSTADQVRRRYRVDTWVTAGN